MRLTTAVVAALLAGACAAGAPRTAGAPAPTSAAAASAPDAATGGAPAAAAADGPADRAAIRTELEAAYDQLEAAFARRDVDAILALRSPDFEADGPAGRDDAARMKEVLNHFFVLNQPPIQSRNTIVELTLDDPAGSQVTVDVLQQASRYQELAGKRRRVVHDVRQRETWVRTADGWRLRRVADIRDRHRWVDGKQIDPSQPYDPEAPEFVSDPPVEEPEFQGAHRR
jgi:hypothetical protein